MPTVSSTSAQQVSTTDATVTPIDSATLAPGQTWAFKAFVTAVRTGGASGTAGDSGFLEVSAVFKCLASSLVQVGNTVVLGSLDQSSWAVTFRVLNDTTVALNVTGASGNNVDWASFLTIYKDS